MPASRITERILLCLASPILVGALLFLSPPATSQAPTPADSPPPADGAGASNSAGAEVLGRLLGADGEPLAGGTVSLLPAAWGDHFQDRWRLDGREPPPEVTVPTDPAGLFRLQAPEPGLWRLRCDGPGHGRVEMLVLLGLESQEVTPEPLPRSRALAVRVVDRAGRPVAGARVLVRTGRAPRPLAPGQVAGLTRAVLQAVPALHGGVTDDQGRVRLEVADETDVQLAVLPAPMGPATEPGHRPVPWQSLAGSSVTVTVEPAEIGELAVLDRRKRPVAGARVHLATAETETMAGTADGGLLLGSTDDQGRWRGAWPRAPARLVAEADLERTGRHRGEVRLEPPTQDTAGESAAPAPEAVLVLEAVPRVSGRVLEAATHRPLTGALVWAPALGPIAATTARDGSYELPVLTAGGDPALGVSAVGRRYSLAWAMLEGYVAGLQRLAMEPIRDSAVRPIPTFELLPAVRVAGRVVDGEGRPVAGARIVRQPRSWRHGQGQQTLSTDDGRFLLAGLAAPELDSLEVEAEGFAPLSHELVGLRPGQRLDDLRLVLSRGLVALGRVVGPEEEAVAGARARLVAVQGGSPMNRLRQLAEARLQRDGWPEALTDPEGFFQLTDLADGTYDLIVEAEGYAPAEVPGLTLTATPESTVEAPAKPTPTGVVDLGTVILERAARVAGRVVDPEGRPLAGARIRGVPQRMRQGGFNLRFLARQDLEMPSATSGEDGRFRLGDFQQGEEVHLLVELSGYASRSITGLTAPTEESLEVILEPAATLSGRVVDTDDEPVEASVMAGLEDDRQTPPVRTNTDSEGRFLLADLPTGDLTLTAFAQGFVGGGRLHLELQPGEHRQDVELVLERGATVSGTVSGPDGLPVSGVNLRLNQEPTAGTALVFDRTDGEGRYRLEGVPPGKRSILATSFEHPDRVQDLEVHPGDNRLDFRLEAGQTLQGRVVDPDGLPLPRAEVRVDPLQVGASGIVKKSGPQGDFEFDGLADGRYQVRASHDDFGTAALPEALTLTGNGATGVELRFEPGTSIAGQVLGLGLDQLSQLDLRGYNLSDRGGVVWGKPDYQGRFTLEGASRGRWRIQASLPSGREVAEEVEIAEGQRQVQVTLEFTEGWTLSGQVLVAGEPLEAVRVHALGDSEGSAAAHSGFDTTDHQGRFRIEDLPEGRYALMVRSSGEIRHREAVELTGDRQVLVELEGGRISGHVLDAQTREPVEGAAVHLIEGSGHTSFRRHRSDSRGHFRIDHLPAGNPTLQVTAEGYGVTETTVALESGGRVEGMEILLQPTRGVEIRVSFAGLPERRVRVIATDTAHRQVMQRELVLGQEGAARLDTLPEGSWILHVGARGHASVGVPVTAPGPTVPIHLPLPGSLEVVIPDLTGTRRAASLQILGPSGRPFQDVQQWGRPPVVVGGSTTVDRLPPGLWRLQATADGQVWTGTATVTAGEIGRVELR